MIKLSTQIAIGTRTNITIPLSCFYIAFTIECVLCVTASGEHNFSTSFQPLLIISFRRLHADTRRQTNLGLMLALRL